MLCIGTTEGSGNVPKWLAPSLSPDVGRSCYRNEAGHQIHV